MESVDGRPGGWDGHLVLVHHNEAQRRIGVAAWVDRGLDLGAKVLYTEPPSEPAERSFMSLLVEQNVDVGEAKERGQLEVFSADAKAYDPAWQASVVAAALAEGYPSVRWSGEADTAWGVMSPAAHADVEWATDELCHVEPVSILCQYSTRLSLETLQTVCAMHGDGVRESLLHTSPVPGGIALAGEVDASNEKVLRSALLAATSAAEQGSLVLEMGSLHFLDVRGARSLLTGTSAYRCGGGTVYLR
ncbi:MAG: MEDS domain-containing protein, partial [Nocardioidaceae bacterium]